MMKANSALIQNPTTFIKIRNLQHERQCSQIKLMALINTKQQVIAKNKRVEIKLSEN